jgi:hypothetical protein
VFCCMIAGLQSAHAINGQRMINFRKYCMLSIDYTISFWRPTPPHEPVAEMCPPYCDLEKIDVCGRWSTLSSVSSDYFLTTWLLYRGT